MYNESTTELLCSPLQDSPMNGVKAMYNSYVIELVPQLIHSVLKTRSIPWIMSA